ncbi:MAG TPA: alpha/beta fold hydrolase [Natronosporangium sp.]
MADRGRLNVHRRGTGPPLLLLHGIGHRWQAWEPVLDRLAAAHEVIAVDLPGFGESPLPDDGRPLDMPNTIARFPAYLAELGVARPHVAGNSLGGAIALELAAAGLAASVTAFAPAGFYANWERRRAIAILNGLRVQTFLPEPVLRAALRLPPIRTGNYRRLVAHPERLDRERMVRDALALRRAKAFRPVARASRSYRFTAGQRLAERPEIPVTIVWGADDRILPAREAARAREQLPHARHVLLPDCGHVPMSDQPELVAREILATTGAAERPSWTS